MFFFTPPYIKHGRQFLKDARKLLSYKRDLVDYETSAAVEREIGHLDVRYAWTIGGASSRKCNASTRSVGS